MAISEAAKHQCRFCGFKSVQMERRKHGWECKSLLRCFNRLLARKDRIAVELSDRRKVGHQMSNVCYNLSQQVGKVIGHPAANSLMDLYRQWDSIPRS